MLRKKQVAKREIVTGEIRKLSNNLSNRYNH